MGRIDPASLTITAENKKGFTCVWFCDTSRACKQQSPGSAGDRNSYSIYRG